MNPTDHFFGGGGQTDLSPVTMAIAAVAALLIAVLPRRYVLVPLIVSCILLPLEQQVVVAGIHLPVARLLILVGLLRLCMLGDAGRTVWTQVDKLFFAFCVSNVITYVILWGEVGALINRLGFFFNAMGMYLLVRKLIATREDLDRLTKTLVWVFAAIALSMAFELATGRNLISILGGVPAASVIREGKIRAQGPFSHPLTGGAIGASLLCLAYGLWWQDKKNKVTAATGVLAALVISIAASSSTSSLTFAAGLVALAAWRWRSQLHSFWWGLTGVLIILHICMKAPVWALIARIDLTGSSSGYHRYILVDQFIRRFGEWWLFGTLTTANWGSDAWDTINSYVAAGTSGGLVNFVLFVAVLVVACRRLKDKRVASSHDPALARRCWVLSALIFTHSVAFFGIAYFDQSQFVWYAELAMVSSVLMLQPAVRAKSARSRVHYYPPDAPFLLENESHSLV